MPLQRCFGFTSVRGFCWLAIALASATDPARADSRDVCLEFLASHIEDSTWMGACIEAMQEEGQTAPALAPEGGAPAASTLTGASLTCGPDPGSPVNVNMSELAASQNEVAIAVNPIEPNELFAFSNSDPLGAGLFAAFSENGGESWTKVDPSDGIIADGDALDPLPLGRGDPWQPSTSSEVSSSPTLQSWLRESGPP